MAPSDLMDAVQAGLGNLTQAQLAALIGVDARTAVRWRSGEARPRGAGWTVLTALLGELESPRVAALRERVREALTQPDPLQHLLEALLRGAPA